MENGRTAVVCLVLLGLGLVLLAAFLAAMGKEIPPALWSLVAAIAGGILAFLPAQQPGGKN